MAVPMPMVVMPMAVVMPVVVVMPMPRPAACVSGGSHGREK
ncbi:hypothetical protein SAMN05443572_10392 [Myxococcus fulvus]|jgi:hypothetical protein|uniref:Uncharacterized protein n=1 Tax=Myxococcus fulvus TaxID=33 RepID=A0ABY1C706_MYXFU|nr:hypothetical protein MFUL124B02_24725 [Myxococcus fulvus 124B02]SET75787.1 hypothetical protein SAMN05443572_10392 [Myxococcus fulvus]